MDIITLAEEKLDVNSIYSQVVEDSTGAVSLFVGTTRDNYEGRKVIVNRFTLALYLTSLTTLNVSGNSSRV